MTKLLFKKPSKLYIYKVQMWRGPVSEGMNWERLLEKEVILKD